MYIIKFLKIVYDPVNKLKLNTYDKFISVGKAVEN